MTSSGGKCVVNVWDLGRSARVTPDQDGWPLVVDPFMMEMAAEERLW